jgi:rare lipoprotein A
MRLGTLLLARRFWIKNFCTDLAMRRPENLVIASLFILVGCSSSPPPILSQPEAELPTYKQVGFASWYGSDHQGKSTANGEFFDMAKLTAAHRSLSFNTIARVTNLSNGENVRVRINDRGPYVRGRIIDLSSAAARTLGANEEGLVRVRLEVYQSDQR